MLLQTGPQAESPVAAGTQEDAEHSDDIEEERVPGMMSILALHLDVALHPAILLWRFCDHQVYRQPVKMHYVWFCG